VTRRVISPVTSILKEGTEDGLCNLYVVVLGNLVCSGSSESMRRRTLKTPEHHTVHLDPGHVQ
jgi:hypothetical protein